MPATDDDADVWARSAQAHDVDGAMLLQLDFNDLEQEMGVDSRFERKKIMRLVDAFAWKSRGAAS